MSEQPPIAEKDAGRIDALRIESGGGVLTLATRHDGQIEAQTSGERIVLDREAVVRLADWLKHDHDADYGVLRRLEQIERTARRVSHADAVVIAPADLRWLLAILRAYIAPSGGSDV